VQIICVSRGSFIGGKTLAERLASKLGYQCLSREEVTDAATEAGIPVGRLEMTVGRHRPLDERLAIEKERFTAFVSATICRRALQQSLVYHGRTGHLVMPEVTDVLRVRVIQDPEQRIRSVMQRLNLSRGKARRYNEQVDEDRRRWARTLYNVDWQDPRHYDIVVNLSHVAVDNAASALVGMAQLPEFNVTPATQRTIEDLLLASECRLAIGDDPRTRSMSVRVRAEGGRVSITYLPREESTARFIPDAVKQVSGVKETLCTMAATNLLWIQERYDPTSESLSHILDIAGKWNAAVELVQLAGATAEATATEVAATSIDTVAESVSEDGGILDDDVGQDEVDQDEGLRRTRERLIEAGCAGGYRVVPSGAKKLIDSLDRTAPYSLVVVGDVFLSKAESARKRLTRELVGHLSDNLRMPVIEADELKAQFLFGAAQWLRLGGLAVLTVLLFALVFSYQEQVLAFLTREGTWNRVLGTGVLLLLVPVCAQVYGEFARYLLRLFRFE
jgi:cytidylate kinase